MVQHNIHVLHRSSFGLTPADFKLAENHSLEDLVELIFERSKSFSKITANERYREKLSRLNRGTRVKNRLEKRELAMRWLNQMAFADDQLREKMGLFWHDHFPINIEDPNANLSYINTIRFNALGNFGELLHAVAKEKAMIRYLHLHKNIQDQPNENFARELLELFTMGIGNYTEQNISEIARAFTGWTCSKEGVFRFRKRFHDKGVKHIFGQKGKFTGEDVINIVLQQKETSQYITKKIWYYFTANPISEQLLKTLSESFYQDDYNIAHLIKQIFLSSEFYLPEHLNNRIKSPTNLLANHLRLCNLKLTKPGFFNRLQIKMGQELLSPPNVSGWTSDMTWVDLNNVYFRLGLSNYLFKNPKLSIKKAVLSLEGDEEDDFSSDNPSFTFSNDDLELFYNNDAENQGANMMLLLYNKTYGHLFPLFNNLFNQFQKGRINFEDLLEVLLSQPEFQLN